MRLQFIRGDVHGLKHEERLQACVVVLGPNDTGKTTLLNLAAMALNSPSQQTKALDADWSAHASFDSDKPDEHPLLVRREMRGGLHALQVTRGLEMETKIRKGQALIDSHLGTAPTFSALDYLHQLSPDARVSFLESKILRVEWTRGAVYFESLVPAGLSHDTIIKLMDQWAHKGGYGDPDTAEKRDGQQMLVGLREGLRQRHRELSAEAKELRGAISQAEANRPTDLPPGTVAHWRVELEKHDAVIAEHRERKGVIDGQRSARAALLSQRDGLARAIAAANEDDWSDGDASHKRAVTERTDRVAVVVASHDQAGQAMQAAQAEQERRRTDLDEIVNLCRDAETELAMAQAFARDAESVREVIDLARLVTLHLDNWLDPETAPETLVESTKRLRGAVAVVDDVSGPDTLKRLSDAIQGLSKQRVGLQTLAGVASRAYDRAAALDRETAEVVTRARDSLAAGEKALQTHGERWKQAAADVARWTTEKETTEASLAELPDGDADAVDEVLTQLGQERERLVSNVDRLNDHAGAMAALESHRAKLRQATDLRDQVTDAGKRVKAATVSRMAAAIEPVTAPASLITQQVLGMELGIDLEQGGMPYLYADAPARGGPTGRIPVFSASHSQRSVALMALQAAIQSKLRGWRSVVLDDLEHLEPERRTKFVEAMRDAVHERGLLHNFMCAAVADGWEPPDGVQIIRLG